MRVVGINPVSDRGRVFNVAIWHWRPLWHYAGHVCERFLTPDQINGGQFGGTKVSSGDASALADLLLESLLSGVFDKHHATDKYSDDMYVLDRELIETFCSFCVESRGFTVEL